MTIILYIFAVVNLILSFSLAEYLARFTKSWLGDDSLNSIVGRQMAWRTTNPLCETNQAAAKWLSRMNEKEKRRHLFRNWIATRLPCVRVILHMMCGHTLISYPSSQQLQWRSGIARTDKTGGMALENY